MLQLTTTFSQVISHVQYMLSMFSDSLVAQDQLKKIDDIDNQRIKKLNEQDSDTVRAINWLKSNQSLFKCPIHIPVIIIVSTYSISL